MIRSSKGDSGDGVQSEGKSPEWKGPPGASGGGAGEGVCHESCFGRLPGLAGATVSSTASDTLPRRMPPCLTRDLCVTVLNVSFSRGNVHAAKGRCIFYCVRIVH